MTAESIKIIGTVLVSGTITSLITYFFTSIAKKAESKEIKTQLKENSEDIEAMKFALIFIITKLGGNPNEFKLSK